MILVAGSQFLGLNFQPQVRLSKDIRRAAEACLRGAHCTCTTDGEIRWYRDHDMAVVAWGVVISVDEIGLRLKAEVDGNDGESGRVLWVKGLELRKDGWKVNRLWSRSRFGGCAMTLIKSRTPSLAPCGCESILAAGMESTYDWRWRYMPSCAWPFLRDWIPNRVRMKSWLLEQGDIPKLL